MSDYKKIWGGEDHFYTYLKYSNSLSIIFVAMMFGVGMPLLFPLSALAISSLWICERLMLVRHQPLPAQMNDLLIRNSLKILKFAPLVFLFNGYWMIDNKQIFDNQYLYVEHEHTTMKSGHLIGDLMVLCRHTALLGVIAFSIFILLA